MEQQQLKCQECKEKFNYEGVCLAEDCQSKNRLNCYRCLLLNHAAHYTKVIPFRELSQNDSLFIINKPQEKLAKEIQDFINSKNPEKFSQEIDFLFKQFQDNFISQIEIIKKDLKVMIQQSFNEINQEKIKSLNEKLQNSFDLTPIRQIIESLFQQKLDVNGCNQELTQFIKNDQRKNQIINLENEFRELYNKSKVIIDINLLKQRQNKIIDDLTKINSQLMITTQITNSQFSKILDNSDLRLINSFIDCGKCKQIQFELIYSGKQDGFESTTFHQKCDNKSPTLLAVKAHTGKRFGGFTNLTWNHCGGYKSNDPYAFIYSIDLQKKFICTDQQHVIHADNSLGPCFGAGHDIYISKLCSYGEMGFWKSYGNDQNEITDYKKILGKEDNWNFDVLEIEVFSIKKFN